MTILALYSNKGGVGKTAATVNLSYLAAQAGYSTLVCDLDPQSSSTFYFRVKPKVKRKARGLDKAGKAIDNSIKGTDYENLDLLPADFSHRNLDISFDRLKRRKHRLSMVLEPFRDEYDLIILDCPPTINIVAENIFRVADKILVPLIPTTLSQRAHEQLLTFLRSDDYAPERVFAFFSMVDRRKKVHQESMAEMRINFTGVLNSDIPYLSHVEQMGIAREPVPAFAPKSRAAQAYSSLWDEIEAEIL
jgi:chromosome partitioning protein